MFEALDNFLNSDCAGIDDIETKTLKQITSRIKAPSILSSLSFCIEQAADLSAQVTIVPQVGLKLLLLAERGFNDLKRDEFYKSESKKTLSRM